MQSGRNTFVPICCSLPTATKVRALLKQYLAKRIEFYQAGSWVGLAEFDSKSAQLQNQMWSAVADAVKAQPTAVAALAVSGMNDVLNRQGYTQASWWNRIPVAAWGVIVAIAVCCNLLMGFAARDVKARRLFMVLPVVLAIAFLLLSDLDSPRGGIIRVAPQNLLALSDSLR